MYLYLEPIFGFEDISNTLQSESEKFAKVNIIWRKIMNLVKADPIVTHIK